MTTYYICKCGYTGEYRDDHDGYPGHDIHEADFTVTFSILHHQSGEEYVAEYHGGDVARATHIVGEPAPTNAAVASAWLDNQFDAAEMATWLSGEVETGKAWITRELA